MTTNKMVPTILLALFLVVAIPAALFFRKLPNAELTPSEKELIDFSNKPVAISATRSQTTFSGLNSPIKGASRQSRDGSAKTGLPVSLSNTAPKNAKNALPRSLAGLPVVSMIYFAGPTRMAIIDGHVVHEGSTLDSSVIEKIEETRVLMRKNGKDIWLTTE